MEPRRQEKSLSISALSTLLAGKGVCVIPIFSFCSDLPGFRVTLLEENEEHWRESLQRFRDGIMEYRQSQSPLRKQLMVSDIEHGLTKLNVTIHQNTGFHTKIALMISWYRLWNNASTIYKQ